MRSCIQLRRLAVCDGFCFAFFVFREASGQFLSLPKTAASLVPREAPCLCCASLRMGSLPPPPSPPPPLPLFAYSTRVRSTPLAFIGGGTCSCSATRNPSLCRILAASVGYAPLVIVGNILAAVSAPLM